MNNRKFSATMGTRLAILMLALLAALAALAAGQALSAQPAEAICPEPPCKPTETGSDERRSQNVSSSAEKRGSLNSSVHRRVTREEAKRTLKYWTQKRMDNATPVSWPPDRPGSKGKADQPLRTNSSSRPSKGAVPVLPSEHTDNGSRQGEGTDVFTASADFGQEWTGPSTRPPATVNGVLFYRTPTTRPVDRRCSASTVNSDPKNLVFTAGSCVHQGYGGNWNTNVMFVPGYRAGSEPYGRWVAKELWSKTAWTNSGDRGYNVGAVVFFPNASGQRLVDVVGANGIAFNYPAEQDTYTFGYPPNYANGERLYYCSGRSGWEGIFDPRRMYIPCDFSLRERRTKYVPSSLGGPWVMNFDNEIGYLHSITTGRDSSDSELLGITFDDSVLSLYNDVRVRY
jgi:V8-like Glu-specific endopeptidase